MAVYKCAGRRRLDEDEGAPKCTYEAERRWRGRCPGCGMAYRIDKIGIDIDKAKKRATLASLGQKKVKPRIATNLPEVDRVLNGGIPEGSTVIISGPPGVGKSTLLLIVANATAVGKRKVSYYAGEQNQDDLAGYAQRLGITSNENVIVNATQGTLDIMEIMSEVDADKSDLVIIDSLQTAVHTDVKADAGSTEQCKVVTSVLTEWAKKKDVAVFLVCHVNKNGDLAGPKSAEHYVDGTLEFDPAAEIDEDGAMVERTKHWRRLTSGTKFRLGESHVSALFTMGSDGLKPVKPKSNLLTFLRSDD